MSSYTICEYDLLLYFTNLFHLPAANFALSSLPKRLHGVASQVRRREFSP